MNISSIAVFCGSAAGNNEKYAQLAAEVGAFCAQNDVKVYYGGAALGLMKVVADACRQGGGEVVGITPSFFSDVEVVDTSLLQLIVVDSMSERKQLMEQQADAFVILPGAYGTMDEFFEVLTDAQLGLHSKPIAILNPLGYYDGLLQQIERFRADGFLREFHYNLLIIAESVPEMFAQMENYKSANDSEWLNKIKK